MTATDVLFPQVDGQGRSSLSTGQAVVAEAARAVDPALAERIAAIDGWHDGYVGALRDLTVAGARDGRAALDIAAAGLAAVRARLVLARDGEEQPLAEAFADTDGGEPPHAVAVRGTGPAVRELAVPYRGENLTDDALRRRLERWVRDGIVEPTCAEAVGAVIAHPEWLRLEGRRIALVGAGAEIGPLVPLSAWGAEVVALDVPGRALWERVVAIARHGAGIVHVPIADGVPASRGGEGDTMPAGSAGLDLLTALPSARAWLAEHAAAAPLVLADHAYADGAAHVRVVAAADALATDLLAHGSDVTRAFLATPTDCYLVPAEVVEDARRRWRERGGRAVLQAPLHALSRGRLFTPAYRELVPGDDGREWGLADALVPQQGPNYALAKRIQRWSALLARDAGHAVSCNVAPATLTRSVTKNRLLAAAYGGARHFGVEVFAPATTRALMAALLVHDLHRPERGAAAAPEHPEGLFVTGAAHSGLWRRPYDPRSVLGLAALVGLPGAVLPG
jgi:hypothetical protein